MQADSGHLKEGKVIGEILWGGKRGGHRIHRNLEDKAWRMRGNLENSRCSATGPRSRPPTWTEQLTPTTTQEASDLQLLTPFCFTSSSSKTWGANHELSLHPVPKVMVEEAWTFFLSSRSSDSWETEDKWARQRIPPASLYQALQEAPGPLLCSDKPGIQIPSKPPNWSPWAPLVHSEKNQHFMPFSVMSHLPLLSAFSSSLLPWISPPT